MSTRDYGVVQLAMLLTADTMKLIASQAIKEYSDIRYEEDPDYFHQELENMGLVERMSGFTDDAVQVTEIGGLNWGLREEETSFRDDEVYYISARRTVTPFARTYVNMKELANEFRAAIGHYLPDDFDYRKYVCLIVGTYYG